MKQTTLIDGECQHATPKWLCARDATWGTFRVSLTGEVNLDMPAGIFCGEHKPRLDYRKHDSSQGRRNVRLVPVEKASLAMLLGS